MRFKLPRPPGHIEGALPLDTIIKECSNNKMNLDDPEKINPIFNKRRIEDRVIDELIGLSHGVVLDGVVNQKEVEGLQKWLVANKAFSDNPIINNLYSIINDILNDDYVDEEEAKELFDTLAKFSGSDFELGETLKSSTLPLDDPAPSVVFENRTFCLTGTFAYGNRKECSNLVEERGGIIKKGVSGKLHFLVIGLYSTESWMHSSFGRKIEKALKYKSDGNDIKIISEDSLVNSL